MTTDKKEEIEQIQYNFECSSCGLNETAHYKGLDPPFSRNLSIKYPSYIMKDPFSPPGQGEILVLGADCSNCEKPVCISKQCSLFYYKTFCLNCVRLLADELPKEIVDKVNS